MDIPVANKNTMKNHHMVQILPSVVACLLFLVARDDVKRENKNKKMFQPLGPKLEQNKSRIYLAEE